MDCPGMSGAAASPTEGPAWAALEAVLSRSRARREVATACAAVRAIALAEALAARYCRVVEELRVSACAGARWRWPRARVCGLTRMGGGGG